MVAGTKFVLIILLMTALLFTVMSNEIEELNDDNFREKISKSDFSFLFFYSQFCAHSNDVLSNLTEIYNSYYSSDSKVNFYKINAQKSKIAKNFSIRGYPTIKYFDKSQKKFFDWDFDVTKSEMKYLIDNLLLRNLPHYSSLEKIKADKAKFQLFFIGDISKDQEIFEIFKSYSNKTNYLLYNFAFVASTPAISSYFFIPEEEAQGSSFVLLRRRYDNFDKRLKITNEIKKNFSLAFEDFFHNYSHPFYIEHFNHRIRNFLYEKDVFSLGIFYRKKTKIYDSFILSLFKNMTRDYILDVKNNEGQYVQITDRRKFVFTFLDTEDSMVRRLAFFMGFDEKDLPVIVAYKFSKYYKRIFTKFFTQNIQGHHYTEILSLAATTFLENNLKHNMKSFVKPQKKPKDSKVYDIEPGVMGSFLKLYHPKHPTTMHLVEYSATFCLHCKKVSIIIEKLAQNQATFNDVFIYFGRIQLYGSDFQLTGIDKVPRLRFYSSKEEYVDLNLDTISEEWIIKSLSQLTWEALEKRKNEKHKTEL